MNYKEEYYKLIERDTFYQLPDQMIINFDERVALAIINNYKNRETNDEYETYKRFEEIKFNEILSVYKTNKSFWEKTNIEELIVEEGFRKQFPEICFQFLSDKDFLLKLFSKNKNDIFLDSLNKIVSPEEFEKLEKLFILSAYNSENYIDKIKIYENDEDFITQLVKKNHNIFLKLSEEKQNNKNIILAYLEYERSILNFDKEKQNKIFIQWAKLHRNWDMKIIDQLDFEYIKPIMLKINDTNNEFLIQKLLSRNINKYKEVIVDFFVKNNNENFFFKMVKENTLKELMPVLKNLDCTYYIKSWINNFGYKKIDNFEFKILEIMKLYPQLNKEWKSSFDNNFTKLIENNQKITFEQFRSALDIQLEKLEKKLITYEKLEHNMIQLKKHLPISVLKEKKIPNNSIVEYLLNIKFNEKFEEKGVSIKKSKI